MNQVRTNRASDPQSAAGLTPVLERNIEALHRHRQCELQSASTQERVADVVTRFAGRMAFVYIHAAFFGFWIVANLRWLPGIPSWDPSFVILAVFASVEAIFLSTFVLIAQNRMATAADKRADLDLQISLLTEHEITKLTTLVSDIAEKLGVSTHLEQEIAEIQQDVAPEAILEEIEKRSG